MKDVLDKDLQIFLRKLLPEKDSLLLEMEKYALDNHISIVDPEVGHLLQLLVCMNRPKKILEIGTAIGYSTIHMARELREDNSKITTIDVLPKRLKKAKENFSKAGLLDKIEIINADAKDYIPKIEEKFDFIFLDAAKGQYPRFLDKLESILKPKGIIVADNVLLNGWVIDLEFPDRRKKTMVYRMRDFLKTLKSHESFISSIIPLGDGVAVIYRKDD